MDIHKQRDVMDACVAERDFIKAQQEKEVLTALELKKDELQLAVDQLRGGVVKAGAEKLEQQQKSAEESDHGVDEMRASERDNAASEETVMFQLFLLLVISRYLPWYRESWYAVTPD